MLRYVDYARLGRIAAGQQGLFTRTDAAGCGFSAKQIRRRITIGEWRSVVGPVLSGAALRITPQLHDRAAQLAVPGSVLAGPAAARALRIPVRDERSYLLIGVHARTRITAARLIYGELDPRDSGTVDGAPVTWYERTIFDCLRLLDRSEATDLLDLALQRRWTTIDSLAARVSRAAGGRGTPRVAELVSQAASGARSVAERLLLALLRRARIRGWEANARIADAGGLIGVGDVVFRHERLVVEVDGWAFHTTAERFQLDRRRQNRLISAGWTVLRFTWRDLTERAEHVIDTIRAVLASRRGTTPPS
jgi:very-short-patch-repair endonuclease